MEHLLAAIVLWLTANFDLPAAFNYPRIEFVQSIEMATLRYKGLLPARKGRTPAELSILVHEMVHHLQNEAGLKYECPQAKEKLAYEAQGKWLDLFGLNLEKEFEIDPLALILTTQCLIWPP
jgi:hypothetical protein